MRPRLSLPHRLPVLLALTAVPALAGDRWQLALGGSFSSDTRAIYVNGADRDRFLKRQGWAPELSAGWRFWDLPRGGVSLTGAWQASKRSALTFSSGGTTASTTYRSRYTALGMQVDFRTTVDFGLGLQARFERLAADLPGAAGSQAQANLTRPWATASLAYTFPGASRVRPFVGLRVGLALTQTSPPAEADLATSDAARQRLLRALAGDSELVIQAGVRF